MSGASEIRQLAADLSQVGARSVPAMRKVFSEAGDFVAKEWRANAEATSGEHGIHYPKSIEAELRFSLNIEVEIGPNPAKRQGGMSFEYGSVNQPPHLDGLKAVDKVEPLVSRAIGLAVEDLLP